MEPRLRIAAVTAVVLLAGYSPASASDIAAPFAVSSSIDEQDSLTRTSRVQADADPDGSFSANLLIQGTFAGDSHTRFVGGIAGLDAVTRDAVARARLTLASPTSTVTLLPGETLVVEADIELDVGREERYPAHANSPYNGGYSVGAFVDSLKSGDAVSDIQYFFPDPWDQATLEINGWHGGGAVWRETIAETIRPRCGTSPTVEIAPTLNVEGEWIEMQYSTDVGVAEYRELMLEGALRSLRVRIEPGDCA